MQRDHPRKRDTGVPAAPPAARFRLLRHFTIASLAAFLLVAAPLLYFERMGDDFFEQVLREQSLYFKQVQDGFARQQDETARRDLLAVYEAGNINLARLFANILWEKDFAPFVAKAQHIPVDRCHAIGDATDAGGNTVQPPEKKDCFAGIGKQIMAFPELRALDAKVFDTMKKSTVFKVKVYDLRGITVYSSEHSQIGEDKLGNAGWRNAVAGKAASQLTHRGKLSAFEGVVENRDLIESYVPVRTHGSEEIVGVFEIYSDVTPFLDQIKNTSTQIQKMNAENQAQVERAVAANEAKADYNANLLLAVVLGLLLLLYCALLLIVRRGQRIIDREKVEIERAEAALRESEARFRSLTEMTSDFYWESDAEHRLTQRGVTSKWSEGPLFQRPTQIGERRWEIPSLSPDEAGWQAHRAVLYAHRPFRDFEFSRLGDDGDERHLLISGDPVFDASGAFNGYRGVGTNITQRKRAEQALRAAEEQFRGLVEQSIAGSYVVQDGRFAYVNPRLAEILGYGSADELIGRDLLPLVAEKDRGMVAENMRRRIDGEVKSISYNFTALRKDGSTIEVGVHGARATYRDRPAIIGLLQDISEKKRAEEQIQRYVEQLKTAFMSTVEVATTLSEMRDPYTAGHERRVAEIAVAIGAELGLDARRREGLRVAGYLHDVGKITIPSEILSKPGKLSAVEFELIQGHAQASYGILKNVEFPWPVAEVALQHHERIDGSGYPQGLKGEAILLEAKILAVADVVEAMSSHRPYRPGLGIDKALAEIERGRGTAYEPVVADACLKLFREKGYAIPA